MANKMSNDAKLVNLVFPQGVYLRLYENFVCICKLTTAALHDLYFQAIAYMAGIKI